MPEELIFLKLEKSAQIRFAQSSNLSGTVMNLNEFETQYRDTLAASANELQAAVVLLSQISQIEANLTSVGRDLQNLSHIVEEFVAQQRAE